MVNLINTLIDTYGKPDEIRVELARELKKNAKEREELTKSIARNTREHDEIRQLLRTEFGMMNVSRNDIIRYKLYEELKDNGYKTLYSNEYIPREKYSVKRLILNMSFRKLAFSMIHCLIKLWNTGLSI